MKKDIEERKDIELLITAFYTKIKSDSLLKNYFKKVDWDKHLQIMFKFWENAIFYTGSYAGNPMETHKHVHKMMPLSKEDFEQWLHLFTDTVDEMYEGEKAELIKQRAFNIATVMQIKILVPPHQI